MILFEENFQTKELHEFWKDEIKKEFDLFEFSDEEIYLSLYSYLEDTPQKFYSRKIFKEVSILMDSYVKNYLEDFEEILSDSEESINNSFRNLIEINALKIHDIFLPENEYELIDFIDSKINYNILRLYDGVLTGFLITITRMERKKRNVNDTGLDIYNIIEELRINKILIEIQQLYNNTIRNGIAHGKIQYTNSEIAFSDKKNNSAQETLSNLIYKFDKILDISNSLSLVYKIFYMKRSKHFTKKYINIPKSILNQELKYRCNVEEWEVLRCIDAINIHNTKQIVVIIQNRFWDFEKVRWHSFNTAYWTNKLLQDYERIFLNLYSLNSKSYHGFSAFNGTKLSELHRNNSDDLKQYATCLEDNLIFFIPKFFLPRIIFKLGTFKTIFKSNYYLWEKKLIVGKPENSYFYRESKIHSKGKFLVVNDASVVVKFKELNNLKMNIKNDIEKIFKLVIKESKKQLGNSLKRFLPVKYIRIFIYDEDMRLRALRNSGLCQELIATVLINKTNIETVDIFNGTLEEYGNFRIVWHNNWRGIRNGI